MTNWALKPCIAMWSTANVPFKHERRISDPLTNYQEGFYSPEGTQINWFTFGVGAKLGDGDYATHLTKEFVISTYDPIEDHWKF